MRDAASAASSLLNSGFTVRHPRGFGQIHRTLINFAPARHQQAIIDFACLWRWLTGLENLELPTRCSLGVRLASSPIDDGAPS